MADFAHRAAISKSAPYLSTIVEFDLYCHYVAGLVGEGLSGLFAATGKEASWIADQLVLSNSMGLLLQKTNILRDFREDCDEQRYFWPQEIWARYGFKRPEDMYVLNSAGKTDDRAMWVLSEMTLNALSHCIDALDYLILLKNQTVFNFCAIPASMAIATLELCFMNPAVFQRNIKIRRAEAVRVSFLLFLCLVSSSYRPLTSSSSNRPTPNPLHTSSVTMHERSTKRPTRPTPTTWESAPCGARLKCGANTSSPRLSPWTRTTRSSTRRRTHGRASFHGIGT